MSYRTRLIAGGSSLGIAEIRALHEHLNPAPGYTLPSNLGDVQDQLKQLMADPTASAHIDAAAAKRARKNAKRLARSGL